MGSQVRTINIDPLALQDYRETLTFKIPPSKYYTGIEIKLNFNENTKQVKAVCVFSAVVDPIRRVQGLAHILEDENWFESYYRRSSFGCGSIP